MAIRLRDLSIPPLSLLALTITGGLFALAMLTAGAALTGLVWLALGGLAVLGRVLYAHAAHTRRWYRDRAYRTRCLLAHQDADHPHQQPRSNQ